MNQNVISLSRGTTVYNVVFSSPLSIQSWDFRLLGEADKYFGGYASCRTELDIHSANNNTTKFVCITEMIPCLGVFYQYLDFGLFFDNRLSVLA